MDFAIIEGNAVANIIVGPLPQGMEGVALEGRPIAIGDAYVDGTFTRNGEPVLTDAERVAALEAELALLRGQLEQ